MPSSVCALIERRGSNANQRASWCPLQSMWVAAQCAVDVELGQCWCLSLLCNLIEPELQQTGQHPPIQCNLCDKNFKTSYNIRSHTKKQCSVCGLIELEFNSQQIVHYIYHLNALGFGKLWMYQAWHVWVGKLAPGWECESIKSLDRLQLYLNLYLYLYLYFFLCLYLYLHLCFTCTCRVGMWE